MTAYNDNVNFVPEGVLREQKREIRLGFGIKSGAIMFAILSAIGIGLLIYNLNISREIKVIEQKLAEEQAKIDELKEFGQKGYQLGIRLQAIKDILSSRHIYSILVREIDNRTPSGVRVDNVVVLSSGEVTLDGTASFNYTPVANFRDSLLEDNDLFQDVKIISAQGIGKTDVIKFSLNVKVNMEGLNEQLE